MEMMMPVSDNKVVKFGEFGKVETLLTEFMDWKLYKEHGG
jgi:hypothetical protein